MKKLTILRYKWTTDKKLLDESKADTPASDLIVDTTSGLLLAAWIHVLRMRKDLVDTFKPYKHPQQLSRDKWQSWTGLKLVLNSLRSITIDYPLMVLLTFIVAVFSPRKQGPEFLRRLLIVPLEMTTRLIRGVTLLVTSPLTLLRIPFRFLITRYTGVPAIEENPGIKSLVKQAQQAEAAGQSTKLIDYALALKVHKSTCRGQSTNIDEIAMIPGDDLKYITYKSFFVTAPTPNQKQDTSIEETVTRAETSYMGPSV